MQYNSTTAYSLQNKQAQNHRPVAVTAKASWHLEVTRTAPNLDKLDALLAKRPFSEEDAERDTREAEAMDVDSDAQPASSSAGQAYSFEDLLCRVQVGPCITLLHASQYAASCAAADAGACKGCHQMPS